MSNVIKLDLYSTTIKQDIASIPEKLLEGAEQAILEAAYLVLGIAQVRVRVETGALRDSGRIERGGKGMHWRIIRVRFGGYKINPKTGKLVDYAWIVEIRYPFLGPAAKEVYPQIRDIINRICMAEMAQLRSVSV